MGNSISLEGSTWPSRSRWRSNRERNMCCRMPGIARGLFDINTAQDVDGYWFGYGAWKPMAAPPKKAKPKQGRNMPQVVTDAGNGRPHFKGRDSSGSSASRQIHPPAPRVHRLPAIRPAGDPDRPTLRRRSDSSASRPSRERQQCGCRGARDPARRRRSGPAAHGLTASRRRRTIFNLPSSPEFLPACSK